MDSASWSYKDDGESFLSAVLRDAAEQYYIDPEQIYLFGHSAGGIMAQYIANRSDGPWRGVATHGAFIDPKGLRPNRKAVPIDIYLGQEDHLFPVPMAQITGEALAKAGHDVTLFVIPGHSHWFYKVGSAIADQIWMQLKR